MRPVRSSQHRGICLHPGRQRSPVRQLLFRSLFSRLYPVPGFSIPKEHRTGILPYTLVRSLPPVSVRHDGIPLGSPPAGKNQYPEEVWQGPYSYYPKTSTIVSHRRWECDCVRDNFFKIWKFFSGRRLRRGIRLMRRKRPCPCRGRQKNLQVGMVWKSEKEEQQPLPREKENRGHGKDADKMKPQTRRNGIARESKSGKTCGTRCSLLK